MALNYMICLSLVLIVLILTESTNSHYNGKILTTVTFKCISNNYKKNLLVIKDSLIVVSSVTQCCFISSTVKLFLMILVKYLM